MEINLWNSEKEIFLETKILATQQQRRRRQSRFHDELKQVDHLIEKRNLN